MKCRTCGTQAACLLRYCPGCGETLARVDVDAGQLVLRPTEAAPGARPQWFAAVAGPGREPRALTSVEPGVATLHVGLGGGGFAELPLRELLAASAEEREWVCLT